MKRACLLVAFLVGILAGPSVSAANEYLYQQREWTNTRNEVIDGQLLAVNTLSAHILCQEEVHDIPLFEFSAVDRGLLLAELARKKREEGQATSTSSPSLGESGYVDPLNPQGRAGQPQYHEPRESVNYDSKYIRDQLLNGRWNSGNNAAYQAGQFVGYFSLVAIAIGVLYRFYTS